LGGTRPVASSATVAPRAEARIFRWKRATLAPSANCADRPGSLDAVVSGSIRSEVDAFQIHLGFFPCRRNSGRRERRGRAFNGQSHRQNQRAHSWSADRPETYGRYQVLQTESDPTGAFGLTLPSQGDYAISVDRTSYYLYKSDALRIDTSPFELQVSLESIHELQTSVDVTASRGSFDMERTAPQNTLSSRTLFDIPFPNQNNLRSGLRMLSGLVQDSRGCIHVYGAAEEQTHHNFEGFQLNDPLTGRLDAHMSLEAVESVDAAPG
jgi:hypothetical protein